MAEDVLELDTTPEESEPAVELDYEDVDYIEAPAVTILVPIYNVERFLHQCLSSLQNQSYVDFEALLLNDGSTDSSSEIAHEFKAKDPRFRVIDKPNSGYGATLNIGLSQAKGTYVGFLESDDIMFPGALERLMTVVETYDARLRSPWHIFLVLVKGTTRYCSASLC